MKLRKFKIKIQSSNQYFDEFKKTWKNAAKKQKMDDEFELVLSFSNISQLNKVFSAQRLRIIAAIKRKKPNSIRELSKILDREQSNVQRDVQELANLGVIQLRRIKKIGQKRESLRPEYPWDIFEITVGE